MAFAVMWKVVVLLGVVQVAATAAGDQLHKGTGPGGLVDSEEYGSAAAGGRRQLLTIGINQLECDQRSSDPRRNCTALLPTATEPTCCPGLTILGFPIIPNTCVDVAYDNKNCGACKAKCPIFNDCCNGNCVAVKSDPNNCGSCGTICPAGAPYCKDGKCGRRF